LKRKRQNAGKRDMTARQFVTYIASRSSVTGKPYRVRLADGTEMTSAEWFTQRLQEIEAGEAAATQPATQPQGK
jgi:hypothetical protein